MLGMNIPIYTLLALYYLYLGDEDNTNPKISLILEVNLRYRYLRIFGVAGLRRHCLDGTLGSYHRHLSR